MACMPRVPVCLCCIIFQCLFWVIFTIAGLACSFGTLQQGQYAVQVSYLTQILGDTVYTVPGIYYLGMGNILVPYPSTYQNVYFLASERDSSGTMWEVNRPAIQVRSRDGLNMDLSVSIQWQLQQNSLLGLYGLSKLANIKGIFMSMMRGAIVGAASRYTAYEFFTNRTQIVSDMLNDLTKVFDRAKDGLVVTVVSVELREVDLPYSFNSAISDTQAAQQDLEVAQAERDSHIIAKQREQLVAVQKVNEMVQNSQGSAQQILLNNQAVVDQQVIYAQKQAISNAEILQQFVGDADPYGKLFQVMAASALSSHSGDSLLVNM